MDRMRTVLPLAADAYWEADASGTVRGVIALKASQDVSAVAALEGKRLANLLAGNAFADMREFTDTAVRIDDLSHRDVSLFISGCRDGNGNWQGLARIAALRAAHAPAQRLLKRVEEARDSEAGLRRETELLLDCMRVLTTGTSNRLVFRDLLSLILPALESTAAAILQRDAAGSIVATMATLPGLQNASWQAITDRALACPDPALILRIPEDIANFPAPYRSVLCITLNGGARPALLVCLCEQPDFYRARHLGLAARLSLVAKQAFQSNEERQKVVNASKLAAIGEMAAGIVHEINQPLTAILLAIGNLGERLRRDGFLKADQAAAKLEIVHSQIERVRRIVSAMRVLARRSDSKLEIFAVAPAVREALVLVEHLLAKAGIAVELDIDETLRAYGNPLEFGQVVLNLFTNAHDAIRSLREKANERRIMISALATPDGTVDLHMRDTGGGFSEYAAEGAFEPFFTTKKAGEGTGLGLTLCKRIMENMGGGIRIGNWEKGADIALRLKRARPGADS